MTIHSLYHQLRNSAKDPEQVQPILERVDAEKIRKFHECDGIIILAPTFNGLGGYVYSDQKNRFPDGAGILVSTVIGISVAVDARFTVVKTLNSRYLCIG